MPAGCCAVCRTPKNQVKRASNGVPSLCELSTDCNLGLIVSFGGQIITGDGDDRVSVTDITTDNTASGLSCIFTQRIIAGDEQLRWYLNETELQSRAGESWQSYFGWSCLVTVYNGYPMSTLKRDAATDAIEGIFSCQKVIERVRYSSVPIGVYYPM